MHPIVQSARKLVHECYSGFPRALADPVSRDKLGVGIKSDERPLIADARPGHPARYVGLLYPHERPYFVDLDALAGQAPHLLIGERSAAFPDLDQQPANGIAVRIGHALGRSDRIALNQTAYDLGSARKWKAIHLSLQSLSQSRFVAAQYN